MSSSPKGSSSSTSCFSFRCSSCSDSKSVSVAESVCDSYTKSPIIHPIHPPPPTREISMEKPSFPSSPADTPSFSGLLRQLDDLEKKVLSLTPPTKQHKESSGRSNSLPRTRSEGVEKVLEESVVVVKESEDPLGDFRRSMLQMIVEEEIVGREDLNQLLAHFLTLNSPMHHEVIVQAFADIWNEAFAAGDPPTVQLRQSKSMDD